MRRRRPARLALLPDWWSKMSQIESNPAKAANAQVNQRPALGWNVFVTPGVPIVTVDLPPGVRQAYFQAMASTLIHGERDAVLVDFHSYFRATY
jgi:hypothetical protein